MDCGAAQQGEADDSKNDSSHEKNVRRASLRRKVVLALALRAGNQECNDSNCQADAGDSTESAKTGNHTASWTIKAVLRLNRKQELEKPTPLCSRLQECNRRWPPSARLVHLVFLDLDSKRLRLHVLALLRCHTFAPLFLQFDLCPVVPSPVDRNGSQGEHQQYFAN